MNISYTEGIEKTKEILDKIDMGIFYPMEVRKEIPVSKIMSQVDDYCSSKDEFKKLLDNDIFGGMVFNYMEESDFVDYLKKRYGHSIEFYEVMMTYIK